MGKAECDPLRKVISSAWSFVGRMRTGDRDGNDDKQIDVKESVSIVSTLHTINICDTYWKSPRLDAKEYSCNNI